MFDHLCARRPFQVMRPLFLCSRGLPKSNQVSVEWLFFLTFLPFLAPGACKHLLGHEVLSSSPVTVMASYPFFLWSALPALAMALKAVIPLASAPLAVGSYVLPWMLSIQMWLC